VTLEQVRRGGPLPAYPGQDFTRIARRLPQFRTSNSGPPLVPPVQLDVITLHNGWFAVGSDMDGLTLRSAIAASMLRKTTQIVLPAYRQPIAFSEVAWAQSLEAFGLAGRVQFLPRGLYRARLIRLLWTIPHEPTNLTYLDAFQDVFKRIRRGLRLRPDLPRRLLLSRARSGSLRVSAAETALVEQVTARHGFVPIHLETLDFCEQAEALFNAECIVGVHGAGMTNILFGRSSLRVLELNQRLDGESLLRPWFYLLAFARRQKYMMLDRDVGDLSRERLDPAIETLLASR
jgi:hypothetical protein